MSGPVMAILLTLIIHLIGIVFLFALMGREMLDMFRMRPDDGRGGDEPPAPDLAPSPVPGGGGLPLPDAEQAPVRRRGPGRLGDLRPRPARRPEHAPERTPQRERV